MASRNQLLDDRETALRIAFDGRQSQIWTAIPAIVSKVNISKMTLEATPAIQGVVTNENGVESFVNLPLLVDVPICFPSAGGFLLTLPIKAGDEVLIMFASRCIDSWWSLGGIGVPMEARMHDLSDGFAIPGPRSQPKLPAGSISTTAAQLRNDAGTTYVEISADGKIKLVSPSEIDLTGNLKVTGNIVATGEVSASSGLHNLTTHIHPIATGPGVPGNTGVGAG